MKKWLKKWYFWLPLAIVASVFLLIYISNRSNTTLNPGEKNFAVTDTASVTRIFMADKQNNSVLLEKTDSAGWILNKKYSAQPEMTQELLYTLMYVTVRNPVPKTQHNMVLKQLAGFATKVEIYAKVYYIDVLGIKLFPYEKCIRTYYIGSATQDNLGTFMMMENAELPFVVNIPGFRGFLQPRYSPRESDWRDHKVFRYSLPQIATVSVTYPQYPERSFELKNPDNLNFEIQNKEIGKLQQLDTMRVISYLNAFTDVRFESFLNDLSPLTQDSIRKLPPFCIITVTNRKQVSNSISLIRIKALEGSINLLGEKVEYDPERLYGIVNGQDLVLAQYFVFSSLMRYYSQFTLAGKDKKNNDEKFQTIL